MADPRSEKVVTIFTCPNCSKYITPPSILCENGHVVCGSCRQTECVVCHSKNYPCTNNYQIDYLLKEMLYPCVNRNAGCEEWLTFNTIYVHANQCQFQIKPCMFEKDGCQEKMSQKDRTSHEFKCKFAMRCKAFSKINNEYKFRCDWYGAVSQIHEHAVQKHYYPWFRAHLKPNLFYSYIVPLSLPGSELCELLRLKESHDLFYMYAKVEENGYFKINLQYLGKEELAANFKFHVRFESGKKVLHYQSNVVSSVVDHKNIYETSGCFCLRLNFLKKIFEAESVIDYYVKISRKTDPDTVEFEDYFIENTRKVYD